MKELGLSKIHCWFSGLNPRAHILILIFLGFAVYANAIGHPFVHDDIGFILHNPDIGRWDNIGEAFLKPAIAQFSADLVTPYYRPVLEIFYRLQYALFGFNPVGFHFVNILIHVLNSLLVYAVLRRIFSDRHGAFIVAVIFVVHPVQTEAVACISGISNLLCAFFVLASFYCYVRCAASAQERERSVWCAISWISFLVALFTKEQAVVLLGILALYEWLSADREKNRLSVRLYRLAVMAAALIFYFVCRQVLFGGIAAAVFENLTELKLRLLTVPAMIETYAQVLCFPVGLHYYRSIDILAPHLIPSLLLAVCAFLIVVVLKGLSAGERRLALFGLGWFTVGILPVLNIVPLVNEYSFVSLAEHGLYLPMIGFFIFILTVAAAKREGNPATGIVIGVVILLCVLTVRQNVYWQEEIPLFKRAVSFEPKLGRVHILLAKAYLSEGKADEALHEFAQARDIIHGYTQKVTVLKVKNLYQGMLKGIYSDRAQCYGLKGDWEHLIQEYDQALMLDPNDSTIYTNRGLGLAQKGDLDGGIKDLEKALAIDPGNLSAANNLSICYIQKKDYGRARKLLVDILAKAPEFQAARDNLQRLERTRALGL